MSAGTSTRVPAWRLVVALSAGAVLWGVHLVAQMAVNGWMCATGRTWPLHALTLLTAVPTLGAAWLGWRIASRPGESSHLVAARFLGWLAVVLNVLSLVLILAEWLPGLVVDPCLGT